MTSSGLSESETVLHLKDVNMVFKVDLYRATGWRDLFTRAVQDPVNTLFREKDRLQVIQNLNLEVRRGERVGLLGVNGAGKTTICRCIAGIYRPTSGQVVVNGDARAIFNNQGVFYPELTGHENAAILVDLLYWKLPKEKRIAILTDALEFSELGKFLEIPYKFYSTGMQMRLGLSVISAHPADLLVLDEVFEGADVFFNEKISSRILKTVEGSGAVVFVSHVVEHIKRVCNRAVVIHQARVVFDGTPDDAIAFYHGLRP